MARKFNFYCDNAKGLNQDSLLDYKEIVTRYPYCQYAHLMFLLNLKQTGDEIAFKSQLPHTAIVLPDRTRLKEHVTALQSVSIPIQESYPKRFSPYQDSLPKRNAQGFSPWSQELPMSSRPQSSQTQQAVQGQTPQTPQAQQENQPRRHKPLSRPILRSEKEAGFRPVVEAEPAATVPDTVSSVVTPKTEVSVDKVRSLLSPDRSQQDAIIDRFMAGGEEHLIKVDENFDYSGFNPDTGGSNTEDFSFGSETLAEMYLKSGSPKKAIAVYENLGLKFPEKSVYFANLIRNIKRQYSIN